MSVESWGRYPRVTDQRESRVDWRSVPLPVNGAPVLPHGQGRSYGDVCLNQGGVVLTTERLDRFIAFDAATGLLRCEAGVTLEAVLALVLPRGWFLPVTPGTKFVSVGGAIANDVHGKNHHVMGCFGSHVPRFELLRSDGRRLECSEGENAELYRATIGGMGLTGLITWAEVQLIPVESAFIATETITLRTLDDFFRVNEESNRFTYTVAWIDSLAKGKDLGRGVFFRGEHARRDQAPRGQTAPRRQRLVVPVDMPELLLNRLSIRAFNAAFFHKAPRTRAHAVQHFEPFFYPLDAVGHWNRIYGKRGFVQYQSVVPHEGDHRAVREQLEIVASRSTGSFLTVLKVFGDRASPGLMSFPRPGITLCFDFPFEGEATLDLCRRLDDVVLGAGGGLYPAKDSRMTGATFQRCFPRWRELERVIDPAFSSSFWRRVTE